MPQNWGISTEEGKDWFVGAHTLHGEPKHWPGNREHAEIIIPICQLDGLTVDQIGRAVLGAIPVAQACHADHVADAYRGDDNQSYYRRAGSPEIDAMIYVELPLLEKHQYSNFIEPGSLNESIAFLREVKARYEARHGQKPSRPTSPARLVIAANYDAIFMRVGKRDGFHCGACSATSNLQLDHVLPVSCGGSSDDGNLQILCATCNNRKGAKTVDYRQPAEVPA